MTDPVKQCSMCFFVFNGDESCQNCGNAPLEDDEEIIDEGDLNYGL